MFDIGFPELLIISLVSLLVIGPKELPNAIRAISLSIGRLRRNFAKIRQDLEKEIGTDDIRAQLYNEEVMQEIEESKTNLANTKKEISEIIGHVKEDLSPNHELKTERDDGRKQSI